MAAREAATEAPSLARLGVPPRTLDYLRSLWDRREFAMAIPRAELQAQHRNTTLGSLWHLLDPLFSVAIWWLLFGVILNATRGVENVVGFLAIGVFVFHFTQNSVKSGARAITSNEGLLRAISFPRAILPLSVVIAEFAALAYALSAMFVVVLLTGERPWWTWLLIVPVVLLQFVFNAGLALFIARLADHFRDVAQMAPYGLRVWGMLSGIFYPVGKRLADHPLAFEIMQFNPAYLFMEMPRRAILDNAAPTGRQWLTLATWAIVSLIVGFRFFLKRENQYGHGWQRGLYRNRGDATTTYIAPTSMAGDITQGSVTISAKQIHVRYRVYEDVKQTLRSLVASAGRRRRFREVHAVTDVSLNAYAGEVVGVIGPNGSGKTTLMQAIAGLLPVNEGTVYARATPMMLGVGAVLNKTLSGRRNILLGGLALGLTRRQVLEREEEIIEFAGIGDAIDRPMKTYSSGMAARLQFAISAAVRPEILIIDEALAVGDREFKQKSKKRIEELREKAGTVFLVTHSMGAIRDSCTRVLWLQDGRVQMDGDPEDVVAAYEDTDVRKEKRLQRTKRKAERALQQLVELDEDEAAAVVDSTGVDPDSRSA